MSKAFKKDNDGEAENPEQPDHLSSKFKNYITPKGFTLLQDELRHLLRNERPKIVETVSWAAKNGDRSENGDYIYGKRRLREIDRRVRYLTKRLETATVVDPKKQQKLTQIFFGATVTYKQSDGTEQTVQLVGIDEADLSKGKISWISPIAKALMKSASGTVVELQTPSGKETLIIIDVKYILE